MATGIRQRICRRASFRARVRGAGRRRPSRWLRQQAGTTGGVTDQATGAAARSGPRRPDRHHPDRDHQPGGRYRFRNVAPGHLSRSGCCGVGYRPATETASVAAGEAATLDFALTAAPVQLDEIVTTATGEQRKLEIANAVSTIDVGPRHRGLAHHRVRQPALGPRGRASRCSRAAAPPAPAPASGSAAPTASRSPTSRSTTSTASGWRAAPPRPRSTSAASAWASRQPGPSRINDLDPDDIESIEIVKGPAAATLYGIQASNGVVRITTKHGTGPARRAGTCSARSGAVHDNNTYPLNF